MDRGGGGRDWNALVNDTDVAGTLEYTYPGGSGHGSIAQVTWDYQSPTPLSFAGRVSGYGLATDAGRTLDAGAATYAYAETSLPYSQFTFDTPLSYEVTFDVDLEITESRDLGSSALASLIFLRDDDRDYPKYVISVDGNGTFNDTLTSRDVLPAGTYSVALDGIVDANGMVRLATAEGSFDIQASIDFRPMQVFRQGDPRWENTLR